MLLLRRVTLSTLARPPAGAVWENTCVRATALRQPAARAFRTAAAAAAQGSADGPQARVGPLKMHGAADLPERAGAVLDYWLGPAARTAPEGFMPQDKIALWFQGGPAVDQYIIEHFGNDLALMAEGAYDSWAEGSASCQLAGVVLMDQFSRNIHRNKPEAFALDGKAVAWATRAVDSGTAQQVPYMCRTFFYLPFMHAEDLAVQQRGVELYKQDADATEAAYPEVSKYLRNCQSYAAAHADVIAKYGRFPHRNKILGRQNTPEEEAGMADGSIRSF